ncbi:MAG: hypothetical protein IPK16_28555 [Anaerolineales bacterium]|nr:hypothetical protein [Anaerolineales bacterium]
MPCTRWIFPKLPFLAAFIFFLLAPKSVLAFDPPSVGADGNIALPPVPLTNIKQIAPGWRHTCALLESGAVVCWGDNTYGALGDGTTTSHNTAVAVSGLDHDVVALAASQSATCALRQDGSVSCWGTNR